ncbi:MAG: phytochelatin synthase family protein [Bacteriovoracaceae bacterium]|nr:phytochelatin synthase family protein [Bacteriovoracaceae bacterium]
MVNKKFILLICFFCIPVITFSKTEDKVDLVSFSSDMGIQMLSQARFKNDFFILANHFESQENKAFCGAATLAITLNSLLLTPGKDPESRVPSAKHYLSAADLFVLENYDASFQKFTQTNIFEKSDKKREVVLGKKIDGKEDSGIQLEQLAQIYRNHGLKVEKIVISANAPDKQILEKIKSNLKNQENVIVINYSRKALGQMGGGHISPVGAYDQKTKRFLILDVNFNKAPWVWVKQDDLWRAMNTLDTVENRGLLLIFK